MAGEHSGSEHAKEGEGVKSLLFQLLQCKGAMRSVGTQDKELHLPGLQTLHMF